MTEIEKPQGDSSDLADAVAELTEDDLSSKERGRAIGRVAGDVARNGWRLLARPRALVGWVVDSVVDVAPHIPLRDYETLRAHYPGLSPDDLASRLVRNASRVTAGIGATGGGLAAVEWTAPPTLLSAPVLIAAETLVVVAVEIKLIGELHEVYGLPVPGSGTERATALVQAWAHRRGVNLATAGKNLALVLGTATRRELRDRIVKRLGRNVTTLAPLLIGAGVGGELNRRATRSLGRDVRRDLARVAAAKRAALGPGIPGPGGATPLPGPSGHGN